MIFKHRNWILCTHSWVYIWMCTHNYGIFQYGIVGRKRRKCLLKNVVCMCRSYEVLRIILNLSILILMQFSVFSIAGNYCGQWTKSALKEYEILSSSNEESKFELYQTGAPLTFNAFEIMRSWTHLGKHTERKQNDFKSNIRCMLHNILVCCIIYLCAA